MGWQLFGVGWHYIADSFCAFIYTNIPNILSFSTMITKSPLFFLQNPFQITGNLTYLFDPYTFNMGYPMQDVLHTGCVLHVWLLSKVTRKNEVNWSNMDKHKNIVLLLVFLQLQQYFAYDYDHLQKKHCKYSFLLVFSKLN